MTAPIVTQDHEREVTGTALLLFGIFYGDVEARKNVVAESGQLWERLTERDVTAHGDPLKIERSKRGHWTRSEASSFVRKQIERRRLAMRERRRCSTCNGEGSIPVMDPFGYETLYDCGECDGGLRVG